VLGNLVLNTIVFDAVVEHQLHVRDELLNIVVYIECQLLLYRPEVHRLVNNLEVVIDVVFARVDGLVEIVPSFGLPAHRQNFLSGLYPRLLLFDLLNSRSIDAFWISQHFLKVRVVGYQILKLTCRHFVGISKCIRPVESILCLVWLTGSSIFFRLGFFCCSFFNVAFLP